MLAKRKLPRTAGRKVPRRIESLLVVIGLPKSYTHAPKDFPVRYKRLWDMGHPSHSFWARHPDPREVALNAREAYRRRAFEVHPDRGGDEEYMKLLNAAYCRLKHILATKGVQM